MKSLLEVCEDRREADAKALQLPLASCSAAACPLHTTTGHEKKRYDDSMSSYRCESSSVAKTEIREK